MVDPTFEEIAAALYAGSPEAFVASRKDRASEVDDAELASRILALRKPSIAAWVVNVFAQQRAGQLGEALRLAAELREAQDELDAPALAKLGRERRALTRRLAETAAEIAGSRGERITPATQEAVERSISAAFFDPLAASAVASGRLLRALEPTASATDIRDAVAGDIDSREAAPQRPTDELQERRARREAERRLAAAEKDQTAAERELAKQERELQGLRDRAAELAEKAEELEAELTRTRVAASHVERDIPEVQERRAIAAERVDDAAEAAALARKALDAL
ncbi:transposase [Microbacterium aurugineum]|uniref:Transposase n=1 Tax=Microbacterium aurugineum TaxID=2851642 RepID=A0ABY4J4B4_9MICO|nr:transposase [Microbacterium aurugineum]UPL18821.1 transposase [Microbacterium aurugineum]